MLQLKNNKIDIETSMRMVKTAFSDNTDQLQLAREILKECSTVTDADRCEAAYKIKECGALAARDRGINFDDI